MTAPTASRQRMHSKEHHRQGHSGPVVQPPAGYWGWSHDNQRLEMMDLPGYLDSLRTTYDTALRDLSDRMQTMFTMFDLSSPYRAGGLGARHHNDGGCGCGSGSHCGCGCVGSHHGGCGGGCDCACECCVEDADVVIFAHCNERRVIPIELVNDTRKDRDNVTLEVSAVRSAGGSELPTWKAAVTPSGPLMLAGCSTTRIEVTVDVCVENSNGGNGGNGGNEGGEDTRRGRDVHGDSTDLDKCEVGYVTVTVNGCLLRPVVIAVAALPNRCDSYRVACACSCC